MKIEHVELFLNVADSGSISKTAQQGYITQQGLSLALKQIESELGIQLFHRNNKGVVLTEEGKTFYEIGKKMVGEYRAYLYSLRNSEENDVVNLFMENGVYKTLPSLNEASFAKRGDWYFSTIERTGKEIVELISRNFGIAIFSLHAGEDPNMINSFSSQNIHLHQVSQENKVVYVVHKTNPAAHCAPEQLKDVLDGMKCVVSSSEYDLNLYTNAIRRTVCAPDTQEHQLLLRKRNFFSLMNYNTYRLKYNPQEFVVVGERELQRPIQHYVAFHLKDTQRNRQLEQEMTKYLGEMLNSAY